MDNNEAKKRQLGESLSKKTAKGSFWLLAFRVFDQGFRLIRTVILAHFLSPSDFGLFGITLMAVSFLDTFSQSGFQQALTQKKDDIKPYLNTSFIVQVVRGVILSLILFLSSPYLALFFSAPEAESILKVISLAIFIQGLTSIGTVYLSKELDFKRYFIYQIAGTIADFSASIFLAFTLRNVWALVFGFLFGVIFKFIFSYIVCYYKPSIEFDGSKAKELFGYGKWIFGSNIIGFFISQIDSFFVAKIAGLSSLGFYQMAYRVPSILGTEILAGATFPAYSKIQDDRERIKAAYLKIVKIFSFVLMPIAGGIFVVSGDFVRLFLGESWMPSVWPMRFLCLSALVWTIAVVSDYMFLATGRPNIETKWISIKLLIMILLLYPFIIKYGFLGASFVVLLASIVSASGFVFEAVKSIKCTAGEFLDSVFVSFVNALLMSVCVYSIKLLLPVNFISFFVIISLGVIIYILLTLLSDRVFKNNNIKIFRESLYLLKK